MSFASLRQGRDADADWLFRLFRLTNREFIDATWGWEELLQHEAFRTNLPGNEFRILEYEGNSVGGYHLARNQDHLWLEMILVDPELQRRGYGTLMMDEIKSRAREAGLPVRLSVLRINPARHFYESQGFIAIDSDKHSVKMQWPQ